MRGRFPNSVLHSTNNNVSTTGVSSAYIPSFSMKKMELETSENTLKDVLIDQKEEDVAAEERVRRAEDDKKARYSSHEKTEVASTKTSPTVSALVDPIHKQVRSPSGKPLPDLSILDNLDYLSSNDSLFSSSGGTTDSEDEYSHDGEERKQTLDYDNVNTEARHPLEADRGLDASSKFILEKVQQLSQKAAVAMVSDPVPQHLGNISPKDYKAMKAAEARNFKKAMKSGFWGKKKIQDGILVQLGKDIDETGTSELFLFREDDPLKDLLVPDHSVHGTDRFNLKELLKPGLIAKSTQSILQRPVAYPSFSKDNSEHPKRRIAFDKITIRDYDMVLGHHPGCRYGPPVTLGWDYLEYESFSLEDYENQRPERRPLKKMYLYTSFRQKILLENGFNMREMNAAARDCKTDQKKRIMTDRLDRFWKVEHVFQSVRRKLKRRFLPRNKTDIQIANYYRTMQMQ